MLNALENIANAMGMPFLYGSYATANQQADELTQTPILYVESADGSLTPDLQGFFDVTYAISFWVLDESNLTDTTDTKRAIVSPLILRGIHVLRAINKDHKIIGPIQFREGRNIFSRNLDGIRYQLSAKPLEISSQC